ncbi:MAG: maleylacetoacetate isomerase [Sphingomonadaceae bacterium]
MILHGYFRSTASWRVRIALGLKGIAVEQRSYKLLHGDQRAPDYLRLNPQGFVPALELDDGRIITQSLAIIEYLDETAPEPPLLPGDAFGRAKVRSLAQLIACDIHPVQNLSVIRRVAELAGEGEDRKWAAQTIREGLDAFEARIAAEKGPFCVGDRVTLADVLLVPQLGNARRFGLEVNWPRICEVEAACMAIDAFAQAVPDKQPDAAG